MAVQVSLRISDDRFYCMYTPFVSNHYSKINKRHINRDPSRNDILRRLLQPLNVNRSLNTTIFFFLKTNWTHMEKEHKDFPVLLAVLPSVFNCFGKVH